MNLKCFNCNRPLTCDFTSEEDDSVIEYWCDENSDECNSICWIELNNLKLSYHFMYNENNHVYKILCVDGKTKFTCTNQLYHKKLKKTIVSFETEVIPLHLENGIIHPRILWKKISNLKGFL